MTYDLVIRGGRLIDPGRGVDAPMDVAISGDRIARLAPQVDVAEAAQWIDATGKLVVPGLIDLHAHVYHHGARNGLDPDVAGVRSGVTTIVDAGSAGSANYDGFHHHVISGAKTRVLTNIHIARHGLAHIPEAATLEDVDVDATVATVARSPEIVGVKVRACGPAVESAGLAYIELAARAARAAGVRLMVHIGDANFGRSERITRELLPLLEPGDLLTHLYTGAPGKALDESGKVLPELLEAHDRGVAFDAAHGRFNLSFEVAYRMMDQGVVPLTISTDITGPGRLGPVRSMTHTMSKFLALGFSLGDVIRMSTHNPAHLLGEGDELGTLAEGTVADVTVLEAVEGDWSFQDAAEARVRGTTALRPVLTLRAGEPVAPDYGPFPWGWLPEANAVG